jgi:hypothetical protein
VTLEVFDIVGVVVRVGSEERVVVGVGVRVPVSEPVRVSEPVPEGVTVEEKLTVGESEGVVLAVMEPVPVLLEVPEGVREDDTVPEGLFVPVLGPVPDRVGVRVSDCEIEPVLEADTPKVNDDVGVAVSEVVGGGVGVAVRVPVDVWLGTESGPTLALGM